MKRLGFLVLALLGAAAPAAELTRVASSFEENDPFGLLVNFSLDYTRENATLTREWYQQDKLQDVTELRYRKEDLRLGIDVNIGLYKDLELHIGVPIVFKQDRNWVFAQGTTPDNTTIDRNCALDPAGTPCANPGSGMGSLFPVPLNSYRAGLGDFTFGLAWNVLNQKKDKSKPTWTLRFDYSAPTASVLNPSAQTSTSQRGNIGDKVHRYQFSTAVSRRISQAVEPYFQLHYTLPWLGPGFYSNCDDASPDRLGRPENCGKEVWTRAETGIKPPHVGGAQFGAELTAFEREDRHQRVTFDIRGFVSYTSEGRSYNEASDLLGKLLYTSDYGQVGGQLGFVGQAAEFVLLRVYGSVAYNTEHFLTNETIGRDLNGTGQVEVTANPVEINPNYDNRVDRVGRRFRIEQQAVWKVMGTITFNF